MMGDLESAFEQAMYDIYTTAQRECDYTASYFYQMLEESGGIGAAKRLLNTETPSDGFTRLWECGRLDLTVEAVIWDNIEWHSLFTQEEMNVVRNRLAGLDYFRAN